MPSLNAPPAGDALGNSHLPGPPQAPRGTVAVVFTDVQSSTQLWEQCGEAMQVALDEHNRVLRTRLSTTSGYEVKTQGDSFMVVFPSVTEAVRWCLDAQEALLHAPWPAGILAHPQAAEERGPQGRALHRGLRVRMGVHLGEAECRIDERTGRADYLGHTVNVAARVADAGHGGQVLLSGVAWAQVAYQLEALGHPAVRALGEFRLKGFEERIALIEVLPASLADRRFGPQRAMEERRGNLPSVTGALVGREEELALLRQRFQEGARLVTILGPGGMGKTRLATHFGSTQLNSQQLWSGGVWLCVLTEATSAGDICHGVGQALDVDLTHGDKEADPAEQIGRALAGRGQVLLILDNMEHLMRHVSATLGRWMALAPHARFLVTSREAMRLPGEWVLDLAPLGLPAEDETSLEAISRSEAVRLFVQRAQAAQGHYVLTAEDAPRVSEIVRRLDGIALAIELAAARTHVLGVAQIRERLSRRFVLLRAGQRDASARQATLRGAIDWSWNLLEPAEREALAQCSVFRGGFTLEAAEAVLALPPDGPDVLDVIQSLRSKSLLRTAPTGNLEGERRLSLYESVREYASERLAESGLAASAVARHADFFLGHARMLTRLLHGSSGVEALRRLSAERENLLAVCDNALAERPATPESLARVLGGLIALEPDVTARGPMDLTLERMDQALELASSLPVDARLRAEALAVRGRAHLELGRLAAARKDLEEARRAFHALRAEAQEKRVLVGLSMVARHEGDMNAAWALVVGARALSSDGDRWLEGYAVGNLGLVELFRSGVTAAVPHLHAALELFRGLGDATYEVVFLINYAFAIGELGRTREAVALLEEVLSKSTHVGDRFHHAIARVNISCLLLEENRASEAVEHLEAAMPIGRQFGSRILEACARGELGRAYLWLGAPEQALAHLREAIATLSEVSRWHMLRFSAHLAAVHAALGQLPEASEGFLLLEAAPELRNDPVLGELVSLLRAAVDLAAARTRAPSALAGQLVAAARQRLEQARQAPPAAASSDLRSSLRLLEQWLPRPD
ncbi:ATP-binding protein [Hyalangium sp.]|uniref:ATP-binding protein n=1 Tax=Hyalangium sp. TaxID=2028555 RepID=UPI002D4F7B92|nr:adenylate/guanylate cyclase domain-containing protein [Hyalangium sp.]HYI02685.1 adenylate/guanylate cyclase domain-containing protein [Hyalangium sp.]